MIFLNGNFRTPESNKPENSLPERKHFFFVPRQKWRMETNGIYDRSVLRALSVQFYSCGRSYRLAMLTYLNIHKKKQKSIYLVRDLMNKTPQNAILKTPWSVCGRRRKRITVQYNIIIPSNTKKDNMAWSSLQKLFRTEVLKCYFCNHSSLY